jgi:hypothetical protein
LKYYHNSSFDEKKMSKSSSIPRRTSLSYARKGGRCEFRKNEEYRCCNEAVEFIIAKHKDYIIDSSIGLWVCDKHSRHISEKLHDLRPGEAIRMININKFNIDNDNDCFRCIIL